MAILKLSFLYQRLELACQYLDMTQILGNRAEFLRTDFQLLESHDRIRWFQLKSLSWQSCSKNWNSITSRFRNPRTLLPIFPQQVLYLLQCTLKTVESKGIVSFFAIFALVSLFMIKSISNF